MYRNSTQHVWKVSSFDSKHPKRIESLHNTFWNRNFVHKNFKMFRICTRKRWKEYVFDPKLSKSISFQPKTSEKFLKLLQDIREVSKFHPNYAGSREVQSKRVLKCTFMSYLSKWGIHNFFYASLGAAFVCDWKIWSRKMF